MKKQRGFLFPLGVAGWLAVSALGGVVAIDHQATKDKPVTFGPYHSVAESVADYYKSRDQAKK